jgi:hypothetical protein
MRLQSDLQDRAERGEQAEEEDDRKPVNHSFSPVLSTTKCPRTALAPWTQMMFSICSSVKR